jgi:L-threonylcarbamoyladenylate synthase
MTEFLHAGRDDIRRAATLLREGAVVAFATETVYGLGADATNDSAVAAVFVAKDRPRFNPLICHYPDADTALADAVASAVARRVAKVFWPGPLTLVLPRANRCPVSLLASAGLDTLALRVPAHDVARSLLQQVGRPVAAPSANRSGRVSPTTAQHVQVELGGRIAAILDCGPCDVGVESTVLDLCSAQPKLLRAGGTTIEAIEALIGPVELCSGTLNTIRSPGMLASHYAPSLPVRMGAAKVGKREALLAFGAPLTGASLVFSLSDQRDLSEAASRLFAGLRMLDEQAAALGLTGIAAMPVPDQGIGRAINDRLRRASAPRPPKEESCP